MLRQLKQGIGRAVIPRLPVNRRTFDVLRFELGCIWQRFANACNPLYHRKLAALRRQDGISVNLGSGGTGLPGWISIDARPTHADIYIAYDIRRPLPFRDGQVQRILAEHVIEHIDVNDDIPRVFREFHRVLRAGGAVRVIVPDAERYLSAYVHRSADEFRKLSWDINNLPVGMHTPMHVINHVFHQGGEHMFGWDFETMKVAFEQAGFSTVKKQTYRVSVDPALAIDQEHHAPYSLVVEAIK